MSTIPTVSDSTREPHSHDVRLAVSTTPTQVLREDSRGGASPRGNLVIALAAGERVMFRENNVVIGELMAHGEVRGRCVSDVTIVGQREDAFKVNGMIR